MTSPERSPEPDPTTPDPVAYWRSFMQWLRDQARPRFVTPPLTMWMEAVEEPRVEGKESRLRRKEDLSECGTRAGDKYTTPRARRGPLA